VVAQSPNGEELPLSLEVELGLGLKEAGVSEPEAFLQSCRFLARQASR
jgi:hypothetical protein